jgi:hypothetical protein
LTDPSPADVYSTLAEFAKGSSAPEGFDKERVCARLALDRIVELTYEHEECEPSEGSRLWRCERELERVRKENEDLSLENLSLCASAGLISDIPRTLDAAAKAKAASSLLARLRAAESELAKTKSALEGLGVRVDVPDFVDGRGRRVRGRNQSSCDPHFIKRGANGDPTGWTVTLSEYQRANLLWLLCDVAGYDRAEPVVVGLQTGDWAGEVPNALRLNERGELEESLLKPNVSLEDARRWLSLHVSAGAGR